MQKAANSRDLIDVSELRPADIEPVALGRKEDAIREGKLGVELFPGSKDAMIGPSRVRDLAFIWLLLGEYAAALDRIEYLLSNPSWFSVPLLRLDPRWDPLRDHPRFQRLIEQEP